jgi:hypothetical protein
VVPIVRRARRVSRALKLQRELGDRHGEAATRHALARIDEAMRM